MLIDGLGSDFRLASANLPQDGSFSCPKLHCFELVLYVCSKDQRSFYMKFLEDRI